MLKKALLFISLFMLGVLFSNAYNMWNNDFLQSPFASAAKEISSPSDWVKEEQIHVLKDKVVIDINDAEWAAFVNTNSMDPILDESANAIEIVPKSEDDINIGDIISYESYIEEGPIIHRVVEIGYDDKGKYFILKGDNNTSRDPEKVRFRQIKRVLIAVIY